MNSKNKLLIHYSGKSLDIDFQKVDFFSKFYGLMFKSKNTNNLLFEFKKDVQTPFTSLFVFFTFLILFLDDKNNVIDFQKVSPFKRLIKSNKKFRNVLEVPFNSKNEHIFDFFDDNLEKFK
jgi:uncharacterized membrane protein (UPF0127 family)